MCGMVFNYFNLYGDEMSEEIKGGNGETPVKEPVNLVISIEVDDKGGLRANWNKPVPIQVVRKILGDVADQLFMDVIKAEMDQTFMRRIARPGKVQVSDKLKKALGVK